WNPVIRRLLGLGYIDIVLLHVGYALRKIFSPFKASLLGDIVSDNPSQLDRISYFPNSLVREALSTKPQSGIAGRSRQASGRSR
ncbi:hypothetical protein AB9F39_37235, partial [Rhizobium leguminosarum]|uniref:hypothetical protein n=1 Tax=Rhizobium leguminosarum TaxID=384 RepID=UPI003F98138F